MFSKARIQVLAKSGMSLASAGVGSGEGKGRNLGPFPGPVSALQDGGKEGREGTRCFLGIHETPWLDWKLLSFEPRGGVEDPCT